MFVVVVTSDRRSSARLSISATRSLYGRALVRLVGERERGEHQGKREGGSDGAGGWRRMDVTTDSTRYGLMSALSIICPGNVTTWTTDNGHGGYTLYCARAWGVHLSVCACTAVHDRVLHV